MYMIRRNIPNCITCINILAGVLAIVCGARGTEPLWGLQAYQWAFIFIAIGAVADFFDGFAARALHAYSELGKELDSLCDLVTFGVAPGIIIFTLLHEGGVDPWAAWGALLIPVAGAVRLARFNIDTRQTTVFIGLPIPANAIFWIGFGALFAQKGAEILSVWYCFLPLLLVECWLMNSPVRMFSLKIKGFSFATHWPQIAMAVAAVLSVVFLGVSGLFWFVIFYIGLSLALRPQA